VKTGVSGRCWLGLVSAGAKSREDQTVDASARGRPQATDRLAILQRVRASCAGLFFC
jgi:hypothetical protein